jgi:acetoin utilization deacetylase AcuC-like enzyme
MIKIAWHKSFKLGLPEGHRFPMLKYELIPQQLIREAIAEQEQFFEPTIAEDDVIELTHTKEYLRLLRELQLPYQHIRRIGFPLSKELVEREKRIVQGSIDCALYAIKNGVSLNVAGGTHHAYADRGEGFCVLNDFAVAANYLLHTGKAKKILIVDLDVHQGNGTADIFKDNKQVFTFSMHGKNNFPFHKEYSDLDIALEDGISGDEYLQKLTDALNELEKKIIPDIVFYQSGVDILNTDRYGKLQVSEEQCMQRDKMVFEFCKKNNLPVAVAMGGGYSTRIVDIVNAHCNTFRMASEIFDKSVV